MSSLVLSLTHTWEPFVLIVGLLFIGHVAANEGLFQYVGVKCASIPGGNVWLFVSTMVSVALVTAVLNLDTAVVFMTPVALQAAKSRSADQTAFLYGTILMANSASLLLVGSNLTNLLIFSSRPVGGFAYASHMLLAWVTSVVLTIVVVARWRWKDLRRESGPRDVEPAVASWGVGWVAVLTAIVMMLALSHPGLPVLTVGVLVELYEWKIRRRVDMAGIVRVANPSVVIPLFVLAVLVGWLGRAWPGPSHLVGHANNLVTAFVGAGMSVLVNNLPAASLFAGRSIAHPYALLVGLDLGPNLFVTGAMSTLLWFRIARGNGADPRAITFIGVGVPVGVLTILAASLVV